MRHIPCICLSLTLLKACPGHVQSEKNPRLGVALSIRTLRRPFFHLLSLGYCVYVPENLLLIINQQALQPQAKNQPVSSPCRTWSEFTPTSTGLSMTSDSNIRNPCSPMENLQNACRNKPTMSLTPIRSACADGYIWRKYGQKQVKIPQGFRSYFRCGHSECCAKKIEFSDQSGYVMEIIYKSGHSHDPPGKVNSVRESRILKNAGSLIENNTGENSSKVFNGSIPLASSIKTLMVFGEEHADSNGFNDDAETTFKSEDAIEPVTKHWRKKHGTSLPSPLSKREKKPKFVVHATGDGDMSGDGYRWRKYGQKIVKGKP